jgi:NADH:ubiquinone oxidoreductase subunit 5 (subunit L)/multisubunit Na+/H+ antiporter MnhA subunit
MEANAGQLVLPLMTVLGASGMFFGAWYLFTVLRKVLFGPVHEPHHEGDNHHAVSDLKPRVGIVVAAGCIVCGAGCARTDAQRSAEVIGEGDVARVAKIAEQARERRKREWRTASGPVSCVRRRCSERKGERGVSTPR